MEYSPQTDNALFEKLENISIDPAIARILAKAREYEEMLNTTGEVTDEDKAAFTNELDAMWPHMGVEVGVTGGLLMRDAASDSVVKKYFDNQAMVSNGFYIITDHVTEDDEVTAEQYRLAYQFLVYDDESRATARPGNALLDEVFIEYPTHSQEMIQNRLEYFHPDLIETLDATVLNCQTEDEATLSLRDFTLDYNQTNENDIQKVRDIQAYLGTMLEFDRDVPYLISAAGGCFLESKGKVVRTVIDNQLTAAANVRGIVFMPLTDESPEQVKTYGTCIDAHVYAEDKSESPMHLYIPITGLSTITSLRRQVAQGNI